MLSRFGRLSRDELAIDDDRFAELDARVQDWRAWALERAQSKEHRFDVGRNRDDDIGLGI